MKIIKYKKLSRNRYKLTLESNELVLYEDVILNNGLLYKDNINISDIDKVMEENTYYEAYDVALSYIEIKLRTEKELRCYLDKKNYTNKVINSTIDKLISNNLLNEELYINAYINDKLNLTNWGIYKIIKSMEGLGIESDKINKYLDNYSYEYWCDRLNSIVNKKVKLYKNKSLFEIKNKLKIDLFNLGYQKDIIDDIISKLDKDDSEVFEKEKIKAYNKYSKKYSGKELEYKVNSYLYSKGFRKE